MRSIKTSTSRDLLAPALIALAAAAMAVTTNAHAQTPYGQTSYGQTSYGQNQQPGLGSVVGALFGINSSLDPQWLANRRPLETGRSQFEAQLTADVRAGSRTSSTAGRLRSDYDALVQLETRYGADGRFSTQERADLNAQYQALTQQLNVVDNNGGGSGSSDSSVADGRADFDARINAALTARRITRTQATSLRTDYQALIQTEASYGRNGVDAREQSDIDARLDALDARLGDGPSTGGGYGGGYQPVLDNRTRLANIDAAVSSGERSGSINRTDAADIRVEHGDLMRLEVAYSRTSPSADDRDYLTRRLGDLEARARVSTRR